MSTADEKTLQSVLSFLDRQKLEYAQEEEQFGEKIEVKSGSQKAFVTVYNSGRIVLGGPDSSLKRHLVEMKTAIESDGAIVGQALPFEIQKFPETIKERVPDCDPVIVRFVEEAVRCLQTDALLASAFMVGAASERAINQLIQTYTQSITDDGNRAKFEARINNRMISRRYDDFLQSYKSCKSKPTDGVLSQDLDVVIGSMFQFCRMTRNEVGHPQIVPDLDRGVLIANLGHVVTYLERIYALMRHFETQGVVL